MTTGTQTVSLAELRIGVVLPADIFDARNSSVLLLRQGVPITAALLNRLQIRGIQDVIVDAQSAAILRGEAPSGSNAAARSGSPLDNLGAPKTELPAPEDCKLAEDARQSHSRILQEVFASAKKNSVAKGHLARQIVAESVERLMQDMDVYLKVSLQTNENNETHEHCLAAAQLAMAIGLVEGLDEQSIQDLGAGCLLSRLGQTVAASRSAEQMRTLSHVELLDLKRTPTRTYDLLQQMSEVSVGARNVAYQIFERFNGSGYPRGRAGNQIAPLARIAGVCDSYVALISPRPHRNAYEPYQAVEILLQETRDGKFDPTAVRGLLRTIGLFPIGSFVRLSDATIGEIVRNHPDAYDRPVIHLFLDEAGRRIQDDGLTVDLQTQTELNIDSALVSGLVQKMLAEPAEALAAAP